MKNLSFIIMLIAVCSVSVLAQTKKFRVDITTAGNDPQIENEARSYLARELRSLGDVEVVENGDFTVNVTVFKISNNAGVVGYAISFQYLENITCQGKEYANKLDGGLHVTDPQGLRRMLESTITLFDTRILEKRRKSK